jgi:UDP-N-acetylglucosamine 2-epimerase (non-hydrolysing)|tara:strand:- start:353 stop:1441 length:1089 start_codon:yes stop_codon:yes gene_type:complete
MKIDIIAGARPNFIKISSIINAINLEKNKGSNISFRLIHTGQHYDKNMSESFFKQLGIPNPDYNFNAGSGTQAEQTSKIMISYESLLINNSTDLCLVVGDVNSTMACSIVAKKFNIKVAHVEAGIRSYDMTMPEEINRLLTDSITDYFFTTSKYANKNLRNLGVNEKNIIFVGNTMIDTLLKQIPNLIKPSFFDKICLKKEKYFVLTLHRPFNVDQIDLLEETLLTIDKNVKNYPVIFPTHPRTLKTISKLGIVFKNIVQVDPMSYLEFNFLVKNSKCVITDSGGITEEATVMNIPCMTLRDNTERPETIFEGTNELVGTNPKKIPDFLRLLFENKWKKGNIPQLWDGKTGTRIVNYLLSIQ